MASLVLNTAARTVAAALQAVAARAIGRLFAPDVEGPRLSEVRFQSSSEGAGLPIVYGRARLAGQVIWATRFKETATTSSAGGGKGGGPSVTEYSYSASFAVAVCEGPIDGVGRVWADGRVLSLSDVAMRVYRGSEDQLADPLIEAVEGAGDVPAFRGVAYVVFEDLPLDDYANRIPQLSFEVFRAPASVDDAPRLETLARAVTLIPASGEFAYATSVVRADLGPGRERAENMNNARGVADIEAALDDLEARLPNVSSVMLVVSWFGDDLRAGECRLRPGVETSDKTTTPHEWVVNGVARASAYVVSQADGKPVYGGTPSDKSVLEAIASLKARGYSVGLYPFILMDAPAGNAKPDPYGGAEQAAFPWRGRITCHPAPGEPGSPDKTAAAGTQIASFFGACQAADFSAGADTVQYSGPAEHSFRRMILHYAKLAQMAGGVDAFLIGSELRGVTQVRDGAASYPAVAALKDLAGDVRAVLGGATKISYAADWSEYFGHQPPDGSGDVYFHLDPLWADADIDFVGVDWYAPMSDWRDGADHADAASWPAIHDRGYLQANIEGGEGYDFYYASDADRLAQARAPITDGAGKPWVFRYKDLRAWWSNVHYDRPGGVEAGAPTAWTPQSKPVWFVEAGCPAVDKGPNEPNVFYDPKSSESALPRFSNGARDDLVQRRAIEALLDYWDPANTANPTSSVYSGPMIAWDKTHLWTWDARPYPDFPAREEVWSDGANWRLGHWLTGRAGLAPLAEVVGDIAARAGLADIDASDVYGLVAGYVVERPMSARAALEPLAQVYRFDPVERSGVLAFAPLTATPRADISLSDVSIGDGARRLERQRADAADQPVEARLRFLDDARDYLPGAASARANDAARRPVIDFSAPLALDHGSAERIARAWLADAAAGAETLRAALAPSALAVEAGDVVALTDGGASLGAFRVRSVEEGAARAATLARAVEGPGPLLAGPEAGVASAAARAAVEPFGLVLDLPLLPAESARGGPRVAAAADPWPGRVTVFAGASVSSATDRVRLTAPAAIGALVWDLYPAAVGRWDDGNVARVRLDHGAMASATEDAVLDGANAMAVESASGAWEVLQFKTALLVEPDVYEISGLLRGQSGSDPEMGGPALAGARVVLLNGATLPVALESHEREASLAWAFAPSGRSATDTLAHAVSAADARRDLRPLPPAHLRVFRDADGVRFTWVRRTRVGGDDWAAAEVPLGEDSERYLFELYKDGAVVETRELDAPETAFTNAEEAALFPGAPLYAFEIAVAQVSASYGPGASRRAWTYV